MTKTKSFLASPFGSALTGGLVVAVAGLIAIEAGAISASDEQAAPAPAAVAQPAVDSDGKGLTVNEIYERDGDGVAFIRASISRPVQSPFDPFPSEQRSESSGSGFLIDERGHVLTNAHVVQGAEEIGVTLGDSEDEIPAELVGADPSTDVALLKVDPADAEMRPLALGDSSKVEVGDPVVAIGNPFGLDRTVTTGIVSALQREIQAPNGFAITDVIQTDAAINPGNSGGPLLDAAGRVIGVNSQIATSGGGSEGVGFAVPIATAREVAEQLIESGEVRRAYLGISGVTITDEVAEALELDVSQGALVAEVLPGGPADDAGVRGPRGEATIDGQTFPIGGDIIVAAEGEEIEAFEEISERVDSLEPGDTLTLTVLRDGSETEIDVKLGVRPSATGAGSP